MSAAARIRALAAALTACVLALGLSAGLAPASEPITPGSFSVTPSTTQAGGHPDITMTLALEDPGAPEAARDVTVNTPEGLFGNPAAISRCSAVDFALTQCPSASQAGLIEVHANREGNPNKLLGTAPIYDLVAGADQSALFGFVVPTLNIPIQVPVAVRTGSDFGLRFTVQGFTQLAPFKSAELTFWGFPAEEENDDERFPKGAPLDPAGCPGIAAAQVSGSECLDGDETAAGIQVQPLIDNPSICTGAPLSVSAAVTTYQDPSNPSLAEAPYPASTECFSMTFKPALLATPTTKAADSAAGLDLEMSAFQVLGNAPTNSPIRSATLTMPPGLTINPDAADGQGACPDAAVHFGGEGPAQCPDSAKVGTFEVGSPALDGPLKGALYLGEPKPGDQYRLFLVADGFGVHAKFLAHFRPDPRTGQLTAQISDLPQVPFDSFALHLFASDRGLIATPTRCSVYPIVARFFPWNDKLADVTSTQFFSIDSGPGGGPCPGPVRPFAPRLIAGMANPAAGGFSDFHLRLDRDDGDQFLDRLNFTMPVGFTGSLVGVTYCPEAAIAAAALRSGAAERASPSCPESSFAGTTDVAAGPGTHPFHAQGAIYMAGPLNGAPFSLAVITPATAGPYDYGTVVVRVAIFVDPLTARVHAVSDPVPQIIGGVPLRVRSIGVNVRRERFTINPTGCEPTSIDSRGIGDQGSAVDFSSRFHAVNCSTLPFKPQMRIRRLGGPRLARRAHNPSLLFDLRTRPGDANVRRMEVILPNAFQVDQSHLRRICSESELAAEDCAGRQAIGEAWAKSPLLAEPLSGPGYAVSGSGGLPRLAFVLGGQVRLVPRATVSTLKGARLRTVVPVIPDAPIGRFRFRLFGGRLGYLINSVDLCVGKPPLVVVNYLSWSGRSRTQRLRIAGPCGPSPASSPRRGGR